MSEKVFLFGEYQYLLASKSFYLDEIINCFRKKSRSYLLIYKKILCTGVNKYMLLVLNK